MNQNLVFINLRNIPHKLDNAKLIYGSLPKFERPQILMKDEKPAYLYVPSGANMNGDNHTIVYVLRFKD